MAVEDSAVLGNLFSRISHPSQIKTLLTAYQSIRHGRATETQLASRTNQGNYHVDDGPEQQARDAAMRSAMEAALKASVSDDSMSGNPNMWADRAKNEVQYSYDADAEVDKWWSEKMMGGGAALPMRSML